jgi:hypothetical protein
VGADYKWEEVWEEVVAQEAALFYLLKQAVHLVFVIVWGADVAHVK